MREQSRREFLVRSASGALALGAGGLIGRQAFAADTPADMAIARWGGPTTDMSKMAARLTEQALNAVGGIGRFVSRGDVVWVKPNIAWDRTPELAGNTNPDVVAAVVRMCFDAGAKTVKVGDYPVDIAARAYPASGIPAAVKPLGAEVVFVDPSRFRMTNIGGQRVKSVPVCPEMLEVDLMINVPIAKHHGLAEATLCMKNYMGVIDNRRVFHQALPECLTDLTRFMKPRICVLDGMRVLTAHGPRGGNPEDVQVKNTVAAGVDIVAMDAFGAELLGRKPQDIGSIVKGAEAGLGKIDYRSLALRELSVS